MQAQGGEWGPFTNGGSAAKAGNPAPQDNPQNPQSSGSGNPSYGGLQDSMGIYGLESAAAQKAYNEAMANVQYNRKSIWNQYGFKSDGTVDGLNPTGLYQQDRRGDAMELNQSEMDAADRGLSGMGTKGLAAQVADAPRFDENVRAAQLGNDYQGALHQQDLAEQAAKDALAQALLQARLDEIGASSPGDGGGGGDPTTDPTDPTPKSPSSPRSGSGHSPSTRTNWSIMQAKNPGGARSLSATSQAQNARYRAQAAAKRLPNPYKTNRTKRG